MAKFCMSCGKQLDEAAKFCASCGAQQTQEQQPTPQPQYTPQYQQAYTPMPKPKSKTPLVVSGIVGVLAIVLLVVLIATHTFGSGGDNFSRQTGDDAISMNALVGAWYPRTGGGRAAWVFSADGNFACARHLTNPITLGGITTANNYKCTVKGKYRLNNYTIECYDVQISMGTGSGITNEEASKLLTAPFEKPSKDDNFTIQFEFYDATHLRIIITPKSDVNWVVTGYDIIFDYVGETRNITVPAQQIPSPSWPADLLPPEVPEYGSGGKIKEVNTAGMEMQDKHLVIDIDRTNYDSVADYCNRLLQNGWSIDLDEFYGDRRIEFEEIGFPVLLKSSARVYWAKGNISLWIESSGAIYDAPTDFYFDGVKLCFRFS